MTGRWRRAGSAIIQADLDAGWPDNRVLDPCWGRPFPINHMAPNPEIRGSWAEVLAALQPGGLLAWPKEWDLLPPPFLPERT